MYVRLYYTDIIMNSKSRGVGPQVDGRDEESIIKCLIHLKLLLHLGIEVLMKWKLTNWID